MPLVSLAVEPLRNYIRFTFCRVAALLILLHVSLCTRRTDFPYPKVQSPVFLFSIFLITRNLKVIDSYHHLAVESVAFCIPCIQTVVISVSN